MCDVGPSLTKDLNVALSLVVAQERWPNVAMWERSKDSGYHDLLTEVNLGQTSNRVRNFFDNHLKCDCCCDRHRQTSRERRCFIAVRWHRFTYAIVCVPKFISSVVCSVTCCELISLLKITVYWRHYRALRNRAQPMLSLKPQTNHQQIFY